MKRFIANGALVGLFPRMRQSVVLVVPLLMESFPAELADPGPIALVYSHVGVECGAAVERLATSAALVGLIVRVNDLMTAQGRSLPEPFSADLANKGTST